MPKKIASLSLDLDNQWSYMKTHGDEGWEAYPSYLDVVIPRVLRLLEEKQLKITFFVVGQDAALERNHRSLRSLVDAGHEIGNHSFQHEPWLHLYSPQEITEEFERTEAALLAATGARPRGFRGPGFSLSSQVLEELGRRGYQYDCSTFPTFLGPIARLYYFFTARLSREQRSERKQLFGRIREGFRPLRTYIWETPTGPLIEIPVTTMPVFKTPIHVSYLLYLAQYSRGLAKLYFRLSILLCRLLNIEMSLLLHPLDFMGADDNTGLDFFPVMNKPHAWKVEFVSQILDLMQQEYEVVPMYRHAELARERTTSEAIVKTESPAATT